MPTDEEIDEQIDRLRENFAELETVDRPAVDGDNVTIDIKGTHDGEEIEGLTTEDYLYEVGQGAVVPEIDDNLRGAKVGDILEFDADHPDPDEDGTLHFRVLVKEVKAKVLPDVDDEWANDASEFETVDELRADLSEAGPVRPAPCRPTSRCATKRPRHSASLVTDDVPEALVESELQNRLQDLMMRLQAQGMEFRAVPRHDRTGARGGPRRAPPRRR